MSDDWTVEQRLVRIQMLSKSLTGEEIARELISILSTNYGVHCNSLLAAIKHRASTNNVAMRTLEVVYPLVMDIPLTLSEASLRPHIYMSLLHYGFLFSHIAPKPDCCGRHKQDIV